MSDQTDNALEKMEKEPLTVEDFCLLANSYVEQGQLDKAIQLYETACKLFPENLALKINLGRIRNLKHQSLNSPSDILPPGRRKTDPIVSNPWQDRYQGLGEILLREKKFEEAKQVFEVYKASHPNSYLASFNLGKVCLERGEHSQAQAELEQARKLNPFDPQIVSLLYQVYLLQSDFKSALECAVDGFILSGEIEQKEPGPFLEKMKEAMSKLTGFTSRMRNDLIKERRNRFNQTYNELSKGLSTPSSEEIPKKSSALTSDQKSSSEEIRKDYDIAALMRSHLVFRNMRDDDVIKLARFTTEIRVLKTDFVYHEGDPIYGLYFINRGKIEIQKNTPYGPILFSSFEKGSFFGDDNLLSGRERFTSALAVQECDLLFLDKAGLATIFARERAIAIHFLWYFWKSLSMQVRESNDRMTSFFATSPENPKKPLLSPTSPSGQPTQIEIDRKVEVLQSKGLSTKEIGHIARLSNEEIFNEGEYVFREGDFGDRLFIVLEGKIRISKQIPGVGEESLAVLKRGDFFGEMALVGQHHVRSADAKALEQKTTLLVITRESLREILSIDTDAAYQFLTILCRILSQRLHEINEKIYQWRMMSGSFH